MGSKPVARYEFSVNDTLLVDRTPHIYTHREMPDSFETFTIKFQKFTFDNCPYFLRSLTIRSLCLALRVLTQTVRCSVALRLRRFNVRYLRSTYNIHCVHGHTKHFPIHYSQLCHTKIAKNGAIPTASTPTSIIYIVHTI